MKFDVSRRKSQAFVNHSHEPMGSVVGCHVPKIVAEDLEIITPGRIHELAGSNYPVILAAKEFLFHHLRTIVLQIEQFKNERRFGKDADRFGASFDLAVETLDGICHSGEQVFECAEVSQL